MRFLVLRYFLRRLRLIFLRVFFLRKARLRLIVLVLFERAEYLDVDFDVDDDVDFVLETGRKKGASKKNVYPDQ